MPSSFMAYVDYVIMRSMGLCDSMNKIQQKYTKPHWGLNETFEGSEVFYSDTLRDVFNKSQFKMEEIRYNFHNKNFCKCKQELLVADSKTVVNHWRARQ